LKTPIKIHALFKITAVADMISGAQAEKNKKDEKKYNDIDVGYNRIFFLRAKQYRFRLCRNFGFDKKCPKSKAID